MRTLCTLFIARAHVLLELSEIIWQRQIKVGQLLHNFEGPILDNIKNEQQVKNRNQKNSRNQCAPYVPYLLPMPIWLYSNFKN